MATLDSPMCLRKSGWITVVILLASLGPAALPAQENDLQVLPLDPWPAVSTVGLPLVPMPRVRVTTADGKPVPGATVQIELDAAGKLDSALSSTDSTGVAVFSGFTITAPAGQAQLFVKSGAHMTIKPIRIAAGGPARIEVMRQPSRAVRSDSILATQPLVRVLDVYGNPIPDLHVHASLRPVPEESDTTRLLPKRCAGGQQPLGGLAGDRVLTTDDDGVASFTDLAVVATCGNYKIVFAVPNRGGDQVWTASETLIYDPDFSLNRSYVVASAIKSISGQKPENEFFDVRFRFRINRQLFVLASSDVALTAREVVITTDSLGALADSLESQASRLTEASISLNWRINVFRDELTSAPHRATYVGAQAKVFNTLTYYGPHIGLVELGGSIFHGSSLSLGFLLPIVTETVIIQRQTFTSQKYNFFLEFFLRSSKIPFFQTLTLRGGILAPLTEGNTQSRIAVAVPIGTIEIF